MPKLIFFSALLLIFIMGLFSLQQNDLWRQQYQTKISIRNSKDNAMTFYAYRVDFNFNLSFIHEQIKTSGIQNIAIGAYQWTLRDNFNLVLDEIQWFKLSGLKGKVWVIEYDTTTRTGYDYDGIYRRYHPWSQREKILEILGSKGVDLFLIDVGESHFSSSSDVNAFLIMLNSIAQRYSVKFGFYDGDGLVDIVDFDLMKKEAVLVWSDIYLDENGAYLRSKCSWNYPYLVTLFWLGQSSWQFNEANDILLGSKLLSTKTYYGNVIETADYNGIMPSWVYN